MRPASSKSRREHTPDRFPAIPADRACSDEARLRGASDSRGEPFAQPGRLDRVRNPAGHESPAAITLIPLIGFINRIRVEEAALAMTLGSAYVTYSAGRKRLIPFVW